eukprot:5816045-Lingulodinium_polyedra.AAC.1
MLVRRGSLYDHGMDARIPTLSIELRVGHAGGLVDELRCREGRTRYVVVAPPQGRGGARWVVPPVDHDR